MFRPSASTVFLTAALVGNVGIRAQPSDPSPTANEPTEQSSVAESGQTEPAVVGDGSESAADRTRLNLLGEVNSEQGEGRRNENVRLTLIDNNVLRELNERLGISATAVKSFQIDRSYWATEYGGPPGRPVHVPAASASRIHGNAFWTHTNSAVSARSFFQVGNVQPARSNDYGVTLSLPAWAGAGLTLTGSQTRNKGQVNGNVLVPTAEERAPLATDPTARAFVQRIFDAYPVAVPNRPDINPRALNTNAPQDISNDRTSAALDQQAGADGRVTLRYNLVLQQVDAFQLVGGQNPNTTTRNHQARMTWNRSWSPRLTSDFTVGFDRVGSLLIPDETSIGPWIRAGIEITSIGPPGRFPVDRAGNNFRYGARARYRTGSHNFVFGGDLHRGQINGRELQDHRGRFIFRRDFGRDAITNLRMGLASNYSVAIGDVHRGFRRWQGQFYVGDEWKATSRLTLSMGMRWEPVARPTEVNDLTRVPYESDLDNFGPRLGFAYRLPGRGGVMRGAYGLHYGEIFTATYIQARINPPQNVTVVVQAPDLVDPLAPLRPIQLDPDSRSVRFDLAPDLEIPYTHNYNFSWELEIARDWKLDLAYVGSRSHQLLSMFFLNRARPVEGMPQTTRTVNLRRPDQRYFNVLHVNNGSRGYFDAGRATLRVPQWRGLSLEASYWWSKAIDLGGSYLNTAANANRRQTESPSEFDVHGELRGVSNFDQPHAALFNFSYRTAVLGGSQRWIRGLLGSWQLSSVVLLKSGTPFSVQSGSDAPGFGNVDGSQSDTPIVEDVSVLGRSIDDPDTSSQRLPAGAFSFIAPTDQRGNLGRNTFRRDGIANVNLALSKSWAVRDNTLLLRVESLNFTNHPQFAEPGASLAQGNFGKITNTLNDGRTFRFTLRLTF
ncbi:MAG: hypothetical protein OXN89_18190 [Bryobacterales bacterium]|nr:hypothetical protein [Bryobacterales bacterium]